MRPGLKGQSINVGEGEASLLTVVPAAPKAYLEDKMRTSTMLKALQMH